MDNRNDNDQFGPAQDPGNSRDGSWSQPAGAEPVGAPPPAPGEAAPVGFPPGEDPAAAAGQPDGWQRRYERERKRSRIFMASTAVAAALAVGSLFFAAAQGETTDPAGFQPPGFQDDRGFGRGMGPGMSRDEGDRGGPGMDRDGMGFGGVVERLFNADGSLNTAAVEQFKQQIENLGDAGKQALAQHIAGDVARGHLTQEQADELLAALGLPEAADSGAGTSGTAADADIGIGNGAVAMA